MPFKTPSLTELNTQAQQDVINAGIRGVNTVLRYSVLGTLAKTQAGMSWSHYDFLKNVAKQTTPWTATDEYLSGWGILKDVRQKAASSSMGEVTFTVISPDIIIPEGTILRRNDGWEYKTTIDSNNGISSITSIDVGASSNAPVGTILTLGNTIAGVSTEVVVSSALIGGADLESQEEYRNRVLQAYRVSGSNGREQEYIAWAEALPQVSRAWVGRNSFGAGTVVVWIMCDEANTPTNGFPVGNNGSASLENRYEHATGDQLKVANYIYEKQPVTALVIVCSPVAQPVDFNITDLGTSNTLANQALIKSALIDMFRREASPGHTIHPSSWEKALTSISSLGQFNITSPAQAITAQSAGHLLTLGKITFET